MMKLYTVLVLHGDGLSCLVWAHDSQQAAQLLVNEFKLPRSSVTEANPIVTWEESTTAPASAQVIKRSTPTDVWLGEDIVFPEAAG